jgi:hypothetical protein
MNTSNTQLTLLVIQRLLEVDTKSSRKLHKSLKEKNNLKITSQSNLLKEKLKNNAMFEKNQNKKNKKNNVFEK